MKFALAFVFFAGGPPRRADDAWLGRDKFLHFAASAVIQGAAYSVFHRDARYTVAAQRASLVTVAVGVGKELYDWRHPAKHDASWRDLAWDGIGGVAATVVAKQADR
jgi:putative lipoprotein